MFEIKNNEKRNRCHLEGLSASEIPAEGKQTTSKCCLLTTGEDHLIREQARAKLSNLVDECLKRLKGARKISCCKCRNCSSVMEQKAYRVSAKRDLYARSPKGSRLKMTALAFLLSLNLSNAWAINCPTGTQGGDSSSDANYCGENCCWGINPETKVLTITPALDDSGNSFTKVKMANFERTYPGTDVNNGYLAIHSSTAPWSRSGMTSVIIEDGIGNIGSYAFMGDTLIKDIDISDSVTSIGFDSLYSMSGVKRLELPDSVTMIDCHAFWGMLGVSSLELPDSLADNPIGYTFWGLDNMNELLIPDSIDTTNWNDNTFANFPNNTAIICLGELDECKRKLAKFIPTSVDCPEGVVCECKVNCISEVVTATSAQCNTANYIWDEQAAKCKRKTSEQCNDSMQYYYASDKCKNLPKSKKTCQSSNFLWNETSCVKACPKSSVQYDKECLQSCPSDTVEWENQCLDEYPFAKKRWTPAEANEWLHDGNDNFVIITFKK